MTVRLFHFTCGDHGYAHIGTRGWLLPQLKPTLFGKPLPDIGVVWLTTGDFASTGMDQSGVGVCDRSEYRYIVMDTTHCEPWIGSVRREKFIDVAEMLEAVGDPNEWWVCPDAVPVRLG